MREKRTRVLAILVIMMMVFALMPVQTVWANAESEGTCPVCGRGILNVMGTTETQHGFFCNNPECVHYSSGENWLWEDHWGGTATCTTEGTCEGCGRNYLNPDNHSGTPTVTGKKDATCTEAGYTGDTYWDCCDATIEGEEIAALGHDWGAWTVTKEATTSEEGVETRVCKNDSSHTETRKIAKKEETKEEETKKEEPKKEAAKAETVSKTTDTQPQTGDESQTVWVIMMMLSAAVLIVLAIRKRRVFD